jgi:starch synthase
LTFARSLRVPLGGRSEVFHLFEYATGDAGPRVFLVDHPASFQRPGIYADPKSGEDYPDNDRRFILFQRAVLEGLKAIDLRPDVVHLNDYQTALIATYLKTVLAEDAFFDGVATLFTIHNLEFQGIFPPQVLDVAGLSMDLYYPTGPLEFWGRVNFLKAGIVFSDILTTIVPGPEAEKGSGGAGFGLEGVLESRGADVLTIARPESGDKAVLDCEVALRQARARALARRESGLPFDVRP